MTGMVALMGYATLVSAAAPVAAAADVNKYCTPGMTAADPGLCSLAGYHWSFTIIYVGHHGDSRSAWMLLPNG
jgi:hypothetical protein